MARAGQELITPKKDNGRMGAVVDLQGRKGRCAVAGSFDDS